MGKFFYKGDPLTFARCITLAAKESPFFTSGREGKLGKSAGGVKNLKAGCIISRG